MYVVFEGADGAGKSTATRRVAELLAKELPGQISQIDEPSRATQLGRTARSYLVGGGSGLTKTDPYVAALLMVAARIDLLSSIDWTKIVLSDRSFLTTYVYQEEVGRPVLDRVHGFIRLDPWEKVRKPDLVFYLEVSSDTAVRRAKERGSEHFAAEQISGFVEVYGREVRGWNLLHPHQQLRIVTINAERPAEEVAMAIVDKILVEFPTTSDLRPPTADQETR